MTYGLEEAIEGQKRHIRFLVNVKADPEGIGKAKGALKCLEGMRPRTGNLRRLYNRIMRIS